MCCSRIPVELQEDKRTCGITVAVQTSTGETLVRLRLLRFQQLHLDRGGLREFGRLESGENVSRRPTAIPNVRVSERSVLEVRQSTQHPVPERKLRGHAQELRPQGTFPGEGNEVFRGRSPDGETPGIPQKSDDEVQPAF